MIVSPPAAFFAPSPIALFDDNLGDGVSRLMSEPVELLCCTSPDTLAETLARIDAAQAAGHWVAIAAAYELGYVLEPRLAPQRPASDTPLLQAWVFARCDEIDDAATDAWLDAQDSAQPTGLVDLEAQLSRERYLAAIGQIKAYIADGDCYQANFTFAFSARAFGDPYRLYQRLRAAQPVHYGALILHPDGCLMSRSPELFVHRRGDTLTCKPMKGTAPIDEPPSALTASEKNRAENLMIVDLIRNDLGRLAPPGGVQVPALFEAEPYRTLWQMTSTVTARPVSAPLGEILQALFPCGSVTGAPKIRAMEILRTLETGPRGIYCGAIGWIAPNGDFSFNVPIRTLAITPSGALRCHTGSGIVNDSDPAGEWDECLLKLRFLTRLPSDIQLIETLRCEGGSDDVYPWLEDHLARLSTSAAALGFACDAHAVCDVLQNTARALKGTHRVRLCLSQTGEIVITHEALAPLSGPQTVSLSAHVLDSTHPLLAHKTTARGIYATELPRAMAAGHFDTLFFNENDELAEGCRSNVFVQIHGQVFTPPTNAGLLNGVCRRRELRAGAVTERTITRAELVRAERIWLGNALRGRFEVSLVDQP